MDSEHRHELKTNELADWLAHVPQYIRDNSRKIIGIALIAIGLLTWPMLSKRSKNAELAREAELTTKIEQVDRAKMMALRNQMQQIDMPSNLLEIANSLDLAAGDTKNNSLAALALINRAEALRADLHYTPAEVSRDIVGSQIAQVRQAYEQALAKADSNPTIKAMAQYGLGLCAEETGNFDEAKTVYEQIAQNSEYEGTVLPARAKLRLQKLDENKQLFVFVDAPKPQPQGPVTPLPGTEIENVFQQPIIDVVDTPEETAEETDTRDTSTEETDTQQTADEKTTEDTNTESAGDG